MNAETPLAKITAWLATQQPAMLAALERMVNTDGGSYDKAGVDAVGQQVREFLEGQGIVVEAVQGERHGDCLRAFVGGDAAPAGNAPRNRDRRIP